MITKFKIAQIECFDDCIIDEHSDTTFYTEFFCLFDFNKAKAKKLISNKPQFYLDFDKIESILRYLVSIRNNRKLLLETVENMQIVSNFLIDFIEDLNELEIHYMQKIK